MGLGHLLGSWVSAEGVGCLPMGAERLLGVACLPGELDVYLGSSVSACVVARTHGDFDVYQGTWARAWEVGCLPGELVVCLWA